jgi:hypothetical protein
MIGPQLTGDVCHPGQMMPASFRGGLLFWAALEESNMFQRQSQPERLACPDCGGRLLLERDLLLCKEHGAFFAYGPQLLVRAPRPVTKQPEAELPWESRRTHLA